MLLDDHKLSGLVFSRWGPSIDDPDGLCSRSWRQQWVDNQILRHELIELDPVFAREGIFPCLLKGQALLGNTYEDLGARFMCDVDLLIRPDQWDRTVTLLAQRGFEPVPEAKWAANAFKLSLRKRSEPRILVELHSRLFYQHDEGHWNQIRHPDYRSFRSLGPEEQLVHLMGHLGYQHSLIKLHWFVDIDRFVRKHRSDIRWDRVKDRVGELKQRRSAEVISWVLRRYLHTPLPSGWLVPSRLRGALYSQVLSSEYLWRPDRHRRYYLTKHLCKDRFRDSLSYNLGWVRSRLASRLGGSS